jgi:hypothetical protein
LKKESRGRPFQAEFPPNRGEPTLAPGDGTSMQLTAPGGGGFRRADAGVGATTAAGSPLVLLGSVLVVVRKRHQLVTFPTRNGGAVTRRRPLCDRADE